MEIIINLTEEEKKAIDEMLGTQFTLEEYIKNLAQSHIIQKVDDEWQEKTVEEKRTILEVSKEVIEEK